MQKSKLIYLIVCTVLAVACLWAFIASSMITKNFKKEIIEQNSQSQKIKITNLIIIETKENVKSWELSAEAGYYDGNDKEATLTNVIGNFYNKDKVSISFKADQASFNEETKRIVLNKNAVVIYEDGTTISANEFEWEGNNKSISAKGNVSINKPNEITITGESASLDNQLTDFKIKGHTTTKFYGEGKDIR